MSDRVGVVAIQGDFEKHLEALARIGVAGREVRTPEELAEVDRVIIPGGESTAVGKLMERFGLGAVLIERGLAGMPIWGTCMGMILLAREVEGHDQYRLGLLDVVVRRNAFGAQVHSFEAEVAVEGMGEVLGVFIRAPIVVSHGPDVQPIAHFDGHCVAVRQGRILGTSFHPELTHDDRLHRAFCDL